MSGTLEFPGDMVASLTVTWGTAYRHEVPSVTVYGTEGVLRVPNPNNFGDPAFVRSHDDEDWEEVKGSRQPSELPWNLRGLGVAEMAGAVRQGRAPRASAEIAAHVVDVISGLVSSADEGRRVEMTTTCQSAEPLAGDARAELLGLGQE
jgi:predicted dehydrogenase